MLFDLGKQANSARIDTLKFRLFLADISDVDVDNFPKEDTTISVDVLKANKTWKYIDCKVGSVVPDVAKGENAHMEKFTLKAILEGISKANLSWLRKNKGAKVLAIWERCSDNQLFIAGSPCTEGLEVNFATIGKQDGAIQGISLSLEGMDSPISMWFYDGPVTRETPTAVALGAGTTFAIGAGAQYLMSDNASAKSLTGITAVTDEDAGRIIELIGGGIVHPTTIANSTAFVLSEGVSFSAAVGSSLHLLVEKTATDTYRFVEVFRS